jgi:hypothetical protein
MDNFKRNFKSESNLLLSLLSTTLFWYIILSYSYILGAWVSVVVKVLRY